MMSFEFLAAYGCMPLETKVVQAYNSLQRLLPKTSDHRIQNKESEELFLNFDHGSLLTTVRNVTLHFMVETRLAMLNEYSVPRHPMNT